MTALACMAAGFPECLSDDGPLNWVLRMTCGATCGDGSTTDRDAPSEVPFDARYAAYDLSVPDEASPSDLRPRLLKQDLDEASTGARPRLLKQDSDDRGGSDFFHPSLLKQDSDDRSGSDFRPLLLKQDSSKSSRSTEPDETQVYVSPQPRAPRRRRPPQGASPPTPGQRCLAQKLSRQGSNKSVGTDHTEATEDRWPDSGSGGGGNQDLRGFEDEAKAGFEEEADDSGDDGSGDDGGGDDGGGDIDSGVVDSGSDDDGSGKVDFGSDGSGKVDVGSDGADAAAARGGSGSDEKGDDKSDDGDDGNKGCDDGDDGGGTPGPPDRPTVLDSASPAAAEGGTSAARATLSSAAAADEPADAAPPRPPAASRVLAWSRTLSQVISLSAETDLMDAALGKFFQALDVDDEAALVLLREGLNVRLHELRGGRICVVKRVLLLADDDDDDDSHGSDREGDETKSAGPAVRGHRRRRRDAVICVCTREGRVLRDDGAALRLARLHCVALGPCTAQLQSSLGRQHGTLHSTDAIDHCRRVFSLLGGGRAVDLEVAPAQHSRDELAATQLAVQSVCRALHKLAHAHRARDAAEAAANGHAELRRYRRLLATDVDDLRDGNTLKIAQLSPKLKSPAQKSPAQPSKKPEPATS
ncbi:hypothetical protein M885DRAFT_517456 [Pelagophyceae sp. CCMP2097]|nr:hypothetical protein M885DRAFT_517456 [Pelagophyceae sp. CCMP2097]